MDILIIIIIGVSIYLNVQKRKRNAQQNASRQEPPKQIQKQMPYQTLPKTQPSSKGSYAKKPNSKSTNPTSLQSAAGTTTAYLNEKAQKDAAAHEQEDWEEERRLARAYGNIRPAQRLIYGDSVPNGKKCVICGYCGAENLVPLIQKEPYSCYFCREQL